MSFIKLTKNFQEYSTLVLHPDNLYISSSDVIVGSQYVSHVRTNRIKDFGNYSRDNAAGNTSYTDSNNPNSVDFYSLVL